MLRMYIATSLFATKLSRLRFSYYGEQSTLKLLFRPANFDLKEVTSRLLSKVGRGQSATMP